MNERLVAGFLKGSVADAVDAGIDLLPHFELAAIPMLDANERPAEVPDIRRRLRAEGIRHERHRGVILLAPGELDTMCSIGMFTGFDELWLMTEWNEEFEPFPARITTDVANFGDGPPLGLEEWMFDTRCLLALGDGTGLNFATLDADLAARLRKRFRPVRVG